jgi:hypothetical protein
MGPYVSSPTLIQARLIAVREKLISIFGKDNAVNIQPYTVRAKDQFANGRTNYTIKLGQDNNKYDNDDTQNLIPKNDAFCPVAMSFGVRKAVLSGTNVLSAVGKTYTYPEDLAFDGAAVGGFTELQDIQGVFGGGKLSWKADNQEIIYSQLCSEFLYAPLTQESALLYPSTGSLVDFEAFKLMTKEFILFGRNDNQIILDIYNSDVQTIAGGTGTAATEINEPIVILSGFVIRGAGQGLSNIDLAQGSMGAGGKVAFLN